MQEVVDSGGTETISFDFSGQMDGATLQKQCFGQRRLSGIRVADNGKGAALCGCGSGGKGVHLQISLCVTMAFYGRFLAVCRGRFKRLGESPMGATVDSR